ncbi:glutamyl aminopeptidase-like isoform X2 [Daktulosphaira vitifoliae]|uniref:glutamyl aminopeptidase-like isoform X2 n=1 Tax=Daktulosphaira vitifoliae TaxID=58002 RepID=UPI0021A98B0C|nr:glutamyl aminopeptidase-like isoform X2 [Daktulosphaira vitifoliae]
MRRIMELMSSKPWELTHRLSQYIHPKQYIINLYPNLEKGTFSGSVDILLMVDEIQNYIKLHSKGMTINETVLNNNIVKAFSYPEHEAWIVVPEKSLNTGEHKLQIKFEGNLTNKIIGFYRSVYNDFETNEQKFIATSKFEPTYARLAFPCFDEPQLKAKFKINLVRPTGNNYIALSNMNQEFEEPGVPSSELTTVHFANTVPMSTYLACFIVCDFQSLEPVITDQGFPLTVYARRGQSDNMKYAQYVGLKSINYYINYFGIQYPLPKLDLIAIPDFVSGAMEHWGLVTFRETSVLFKEGVSSSSNQEQVALTVAHELAHMWFGNLATMKWWNDLWLNEGFASYMEFKAIDVVHPNWDVDTIFLVHSLQSVQSLDDKISSHAIVQDVSHPDQITEIFDRISYDKGSSVIRMLEGILGNNVFQAGVSAYLKRNEFSNAETDDLWAELQAAAQNSVDVKKVMDTWTRQAGFPVVTIKRNGSKITLSQQRFLADSNANYSLESSPYKYKWEIPITYITSNDNSIHEIWLHKDQNSITVDIPGDFDWIKFNHRQIGYFMVNYSESDWSLLSNLLEKNINALNAADRSNLIHDAFSLAEASHLPYSVALNITKYLVTENHYAPWYVAASSLINLRINLYYRPAHYNLDKYIQNLIGQLSQDFWIDSNDRNFLQRKIRGVILNLGCLVGLPSFQAKALELFKKYLKDKIKPDPDVRRIVYYYGMASGSVDEWNQLWKLFLSEHEPQERIKLMYALTAVKEPWILTRLIQMAKNESCVRSQDYFILLTNIGHNPVGSLLLWDFLRDEWEYLVDRFTLNDRAFGRLIPSVCARFNSPRRLEEMKEFFSKYPEAGAGAAGRRTALEAVSNNIKWLEQHEIIISDWLTNAL